MARTPRGRKNSPSNDAGELLEDLRELSSGEEHEAQLLRRHGHRDLIQRRCIHVEGSLCRGVHPHPVARGAHEEWHRLIRRAALRPAIVLGCILYNRVRPVQRVEVLSEAEVVCVVAYQEAPFTDGVRYARDLDGCRRESFEMQLAGIDNVSIELKPVQEEVGKGRAAGGLHSG